MASTASGLLAWCKAHLQATVTGSSPYTYDLSGTDAVVYAALPAPGQIALDTQVYFYDEEIETEPGQPLTAWNQILRVYWIAFASNTGTTILAGKQAALNLAADIIGAFRTNRTASTATLASGSAVHDVRCGAETVQGDAMGYKGRIIVAGRVDIYYRGTF